ncbi:(2,3-dihydroxybenzoyl)adenylate synthase [Dactylosporangium sp. CA-092794]|uniref:(2,3-dihydroxybenzoyl)adenylate synthase n=1 Tax=Dactylosporangium sp. CA-092794 TaxID=3239929 RepID=UPI003D92A58D
MLLSGVVPFPQEFAARYRARGYWDDRLLIEHWEDAFAAFGDRVAVIDDQERWTYAELEQRSIRLAGVLVDLGLRPRDRVVVQLPNTNAFVCLYVALQRIGAIPIMALPSHRYREVEQFVRLSGAVALASPARVKDTDFTEIFERVAADQPSLRWHLTLGAADTTGDKRRLDLAELMAGEPITSAQDLLDLRGDLDPEDPAVFQLSGGTTGIPKLIPRSHNDYAFNSRLAVSVCDVRPGDVLLDVLPISHNLPLACPGLQGFVFAGATVALSTSTRAGDVFARIQRDGCTHMHVVPALLIKLINDPAADEFDLGSMRVIQSGGQRLQPETRRGAQRVFDRATVQENFGMAEGLLMFVRLDDPEEVRMETVGRPICVDDEVRLVDADGRDVADGEVGELWARGPYTLRGYYNAAEHNARAFSPDGFYMSGDLMWRHPSGNYVVAGRTKDLINRGGEKISAEEVENLILTHPAVLNVACVPVDHEVLGEQMCACVILRPGATLTLRELVVHLTGFELAKHKLPEHLRIYDAFPLSPVGKVSKKDLVAQLRAPVE